MIKFLRNLMQNNPIETQPKVTTIMSSTIDPISVERLEFLRRRKAVVEPMITQLNKYAYSSAAGVVTTNIVEALKQAQTELILIDLEIEVLKDHFKQVKTPPNALLAV